MNGKPEIRQQDCPLKAISLPPFVSYKLGQMTETSSLKKVWPELGIEKGLLCDCKFGRVPQGFRTKQSSGTAICIADERLARGSCVHRFDLGRRND